MRRTPAPPRRPPPGISPGQNVRVARMQAAMAAARDLVWLRQAAGLTEAELAARAGVDEDALREAEEGEYGGDVADLLRRVAAALQSVG